MAQLYLIDANPAQEAPLDLQQQPIISPKGVVIARVVRIPKWQAFPMPINVKDAHLVNGVLVLVLRKNPPASIAERANLDGQTVKVPRPKRRARIVVEAPIWKKLEPTASTVARIVLWGLLKTIPAKLSVCPASVAVTAVKMVRPNVQSASLEERPRKLQEQQNATTAPKAATKTNKAPRPA